MDCELVTTRAQYESVRTHLVRVRPNAEEAGFAYVRPLDGECRFEILLWEPVPDHGFAYKSLYGLELTDEYRARVIKKAHDLDAALMEFHSHPIANSAAFSGSDRFGFRDFVPHVRWRLKQKPYLAAVFAARGFDSLWWMSSSSIPDGVVTLSVDGRTVPPSATTLRSWKGLDDLETL